MTDSALTQPRPRRSILIGSAIAAGVAVAVAIFLGQEYRLSSNLRKAQLHVPIVRAKIEGDHRFVAVKVDDSPTLYGSLLIRGFVVSDEDASALREAIEATGPPVALDWKLKVLGSAALTEALQRVKPPATTQGAAIPEGSTR